MVQDRTKRWIGYTMSGLVVAFMLFDASMKLVPLDIVIKSTADLGFPASAEFDRGLGILALVCAVLYVVPRTTVLGAVLLTGFMGGTVASHLRVGAPLFTHVLFGVYLALLAWGGLYLREPRVRALLPLRSDSPDA
jgi:hypothetical protein